MCLSFNHLSSDEKEQARWGWWENFSFQNLLQFYKIELLECMYT